MSTTPKVCPPDHKHAAMSTCYKGHGCRCAPCRAANSASCRDRRKAIAYGRWGARFVDAAPVREHLRMLRAAGMTVAELDRLALTNVARILYGWRTPDGLEHVDRVHRDTAARILAVQPVELPKPDGAYIDATGTRRRLQALAVLGWPTGTLAARLRLHRFTLNRMLRQPLVTAGAARKVAALFDELWATTPQPADRWERALVSRTRSWARREGWLPPLAWDDIDTDPEPPTAAPEQDDDVDVIAIELAVDGNRVHLSTDERRIAVAELTARAHSAPEIALMLGVTSKTIERDRAALAVEQDEEAAA